MDNRTKRIRDFLNEPLQFHSHKDRHWTVPVRSRSAEYLKGTNRAPHDRYGYTEHDIPSMRHKQDIEKKRMDNTMSIRERRMVMERERAEYLKTLASGNYYSKMEE